MVVLTELSSVFWGVALEGGQKKYTQTTKRPVHISMAALDPTKKSDDGPLSVMIEHSTGSYVLCTLQRGVLFQQPLNLDFAAGEELSFYINGNGSIHLSGYFMPEDNYPSDSDLEDDYDSEDVGSDEEESDEDEVTAKGKRRRNSGSTNKSKKARLVLNDDEDDDDDDSDDEDFIVDEAEEASEDEDEDEDEDEFDDDELEEESDDEETPKKGKKESSSKAVVVVKPGKETAKANSANVPSESKKKTNAENQNTPSQRAQKNGSQSQQAGNASVETEGKKKKKKKNKKKKNKNNEQNQQQQQPSTSTESTTRATPPSKPTKRVAEGGVVIEELKEGHGPETKMGKMVRVYYTGRLANGKVFDACTSGNGFKFKLGKKEVISGWDVGLKGMKVGGKRKLVIPPQMGYGTQRAGPIPPNSTLVFDVELKAVG